MAQRKEDSGKAPAASQAMWKGANDRVRLSESFEAKPSAQVPSACHLGLKGAVGTRKSAPYASRRKADWIRPKCSYLQDFVVCGHNDRPGSRTGIGALLLGVRGDDGALRYTGSVGTGFTERTPQELPPGPTALTTTKIPSSEGTVVGRKTHWVKLRLIAEVPLAERTKEGRIQHPVCAQGGRTPAPGQCTLGRLCGQELTARVSVSQKPKKKTQ